MGDTPDEVVAVSERFRRLEEHFTEHATRIERQLDALVLAFNRMGDATEALVASLEKLTDDDNGDSDEDGSEPGGFTGVETQRGIPTGDNRYVDNGIVIPNHNDTESKPKPSVPDHLQRFTDDG